MIKVLLLALQVAFALAPGDKLPDIAAKNQNGKLVHMTDYKGKYVLLYFYPKDQTPGCTKEAQALRDSYKKIKSLNGEVVGISRQDEKSHQDFIAHEKLPYDLLVDTDGNLGQALGVGSIPVMGLSKRQSLLVDPNGKVVKFYEDVDPTKHADEVIQDLQKFSAKK